MKGPPAHPSEPAYPCCLPALGRFTGWTPRGGSATNSTGQGRSAPKPLLDSNRGAGTPPSQVGSPAEDSPSGLWRSLGKRVGGNPSGVQIPYPPPECCYSNSECSNHRERCFELSLQLVLEGGVSHGSAAFFVSANRPSVLGGSGVGRPSWQTVRSARRSQPLELRRDQCRLAAPKHELVELAPCWRIQLGILTVGLVEVRQDTVGVLAASCELLAGIS